MVKSCVLVFQSPCSNILYSVMCFTKPFKDALLRLNVNPTCCQWTCLSVECCVFEHSITFSVFCCPCPFLISASSFSVFPCVPLLPSVSCISPFVYLCVTESGALTSCCNQSPASCCQSACTPAAHPLIKLQQYTHSAFPSSLCQIIPSPTVVANASGYFLVFLWIF